MDKLVEDFPIERRQMAEEYKGYPRAIRENFIFNVLNKQIGLTKAAEIHSAQKQKYN